MKSAILNRRSIRKYKNTAVPRSMLEEILQAGALAPSSKNRQPWRFIVVSGEAKEVMLSAMSRGLERERREPLLPQSAGHLGGAEHTLQIMRQAPAVIFVVNTEGLSLHCPLNPEERISEICNAQSIGAAIENMTLTACELGLGSLWICDTYFAYEELSGFLDTDGELFATLAVGYPEENPSARPRKSMNDTVEWRE